MPYIASSRTSTGGMTGSEALARRGCRARAARARTAAARCRRAGRRTASRWCARRGRCRGRRGARPSATWSRGSKSNVGTLAGHRLSSTRVLLGEAVGRARRAGGSGWPRAGRRARPRRSASCGSTCLSSADTPATSSISVCFSAPSARPIALEARFCAARSSSTRVVSSRRRASAASSSSTAPRGSAERALRGRAPGPPGSA